jgi:5-hydroxyisourate hydrolase
MSQVTTHVLDTTLGLAAPGITVILYHHLSNSWIEVANGLTNMDGRIADLLPDEIILEPGTYKIKFETKFYFDQAEMLTFYPYVEIVFDIKDNKHYHVPLLISPFAYSTYRGS